MTVVVPAYLGKRAYTARMDRQVIAEMLGAGVSQPGDLIPSLPGGLVVRIGAGSGIVRGTTVIGPQGSYRAYNDANVDVAVPAADPSNPRVDRIVLRVHDSQEVPGDTDGAAFEVVAGTPTAAADLVNLNGAAALPVNSLLVADTLLPTAGAAITAIKDRRIFSRLNMLPPVKTITMGDGVVLAPVPEIPVNSAGASYNVDHHVAYAVALETRIAAARIRFGYVQPGASPLVGNVMISIHDASGRLIANTASTAINEAINTRVSKSIAFAQGTVTFEPGTYYVLWQLDFTSGSTTYPACVAFYVATNIIAGGPNLVFDRAYAALAAQNNLDLYNDCFPNGVVSQSANPINVPVFALTTV